MPISEDEYERRPNQSTMSKAEQRRNNKPIMEKRRRARINHCLNELKTLILDAMKKDPARHSKLEKADILEMTVKHLQTLQRQQLAVAVATDPNVLQKFKTGFNECAGEVSRYIGNMDGVETGVKQRLVAHLSNCVTGLQQPSPFTIPGVSTIASSTGSIPITITQGNANSSSTTSSGGFNGDVNNNQNTTRIQVPPGIQLIPSRLPTGELALLVPNSSNMPFFSSSVIGGTDIATSSSSTDLSNQRSSSNSAFTTVRPKHSDSLKMSSPPLSPASSTTSFEDHQVVENFHRPRTPSPKAVTISFPTPPGSSGYKLKNSTIIQEQSPPQQFQVTSTSYSPENKEFGLKIEYKAVPIYQPQDKGFKHISSKSLEPLSVITDKSKLSNKENYHHHHHHHHQSYNIENAPIIHRKRPYSSDSSEGLLVVANHDPSPSTSKYARYSLDDVSTTSSSSSSGSPDQRFFVENHFHQPSTSGYGNNQQGDTNNEHMWRPW